MEAQGLIARHWIAGTRLYKLGLELQLGIANSTPGQTHKELLHELTDQAAQWLDSKALQSLRHDWQLNNVDVGTTEAASSTTQGKPIAEQPLALRLLQALYPQLHPQAPGSPVDRESRWQQLITSNKQRYRLLNADKTSQSSKPVTAGLQPNRSNRPFGVNLIGHAFEVFGIGEDIRMAARALQASEVPCCVIHHPAGNGAACTDRSLEALLCNDPNGGPYAFNLVCMAAPSQARWLLESGLDPLRERYTIAAWPWETRQWPRFGPPRLLMKSGPQVPSQPPSKPAAQPTFRCM